MYHVYKNNVVSVVRGDYLELRIPLIQGRFPFQKKIEIHDGDTLFFGMTHHHEPFERAILKIPYTKEDLNSEGDLLVVIEPEDTIHMLPGVYYYEVKLLTEDSKITTIIPKSKFIIT